MNRTKTLAFYKRVVFLVNRPFQLKFSFIVTSIVVISTSIYPFIIYDFFNILTLQETQIPQNILAAQKEMLAYLILIQIVVSLLVFILFIFVSHKIAGPIYHLKKHLISVREGNPITPITFRKGDYFNDLAEEVTQFMDTIVKNQENDFEYIEEVSEYIENLSNIVPDDKKPVLNEITRRLIEIKSRYKKNH